MSSVISGQNRNLGATDAKTRAANFSFSSSGWYGPVTGHPGVCIHIAVIPCCSTAEITSTLSGHEMERLMTRLCSLPFVIAPEEAGINAFAKLLRRWAVVSLRSFQRANLHRLRRSGHFGHRRFLPSQKRIVFSQAVVCLGVMCPFWRCCAVWNWRVNYFVGPRHLIVHGKGHKHLQMSKLHG